MGESYSTDTSKSIVTDHDSESLVAMLHLKNLETFGIISPILSNHLAMGGYIRASTGGMEMKAPWSRFLSAELHINTWRSKGGRYRGERIFKLQQERVKVRAAPFSHFDLLPGSCCRSHQGCHAGEHTPIRLHGLHHDRSLPGRSQ